VQSHFSSRAPGTAPSCLPAGRAVCGGVHTGQGEGHPKNLFIRITSRAGRAQSKLDMPQESFTQIRDGCAYSLLLVFVFFYAILSFVGEFIVDCPHSVADNLAANKANPVGWSNPAYAYNPCLFVRHISLLGLNLQECICTRRLVVSCFLGAMIGCERRSADRPVSPAKSPPSDHACVCVFSQAGIRTMSLVALGSSIFTLCSVFAFVDSSMAWDSSRVVSEQRDCDPDCSSVFPLLARPLCR
jgi:hypothetical protein